MKDIGKGCEGKLWLSNVGWVEDVKREFLERKGIGFEMIGGGGVFCRLGEGSRKAFTMVGYVCWHGI